MPFTAPSPDDIVQEPFTPPGEDDLIVTDASGAQPIGPRRRPLLDPTGDQSTTRGGPPVPLASASDTIGDIAEPLRPAMRGIATGGRVLAALPPDIDTALSEDKTGTKPFENVKAAYSGATPPYLTRAQSPGIPPAMQMAQKVTTGGIEMVPKMAGVAVASLGGPVASAAAAGTLFGFDDEGTFHPAQAGVAAVLPLAGKWAGGIAGRIAQRAGMEAGTALNLVKAGTGYATANAILTAQAVPGWQKMTDAQKQDTVAGIMVNAFLGLADLYGVGETTTGKVDLSKASKIFTDAAEKAKSGTQPFDAKRLEELAKQSRAIPEPVIPKSDLDGGAKVSIDTIMQKYGVGRDTAVAMRSKALDRFGMIKDVAETKPVEPPAAEPSPLEQRLQKPETFVGKDWTKDSYTYSATATPEQLTELQKLQKQYTDEMRAIPKTIENFGKIGEVGKRNQWVNEALKFRAALDEARSTGAKTDAELAAIAKKHGVGAGRGGDDAAYAKDLKEGMGSSAEPPPVAPKPVDQPVNKVGEREIPKPKKLKNPTYAVRKAAVEYHANQDLLDGGIKGPERDKLEARQKELVDQYKKATDPSRIGGKGINRWYYHPSGQNDILDDINDMGGIATPSQTRFASKCDYDGYNEAFGGGMAKRLRRSEGGIPPDKIVQGLQKLEGKSYGKIQSTSDLYDAVQKAVKERQGVEGVAGREQKVVEIESKQAEEFGNEALNPANKAAPVNAGDKLGVGSTFALRGEKFKVTEFDPDSDTFIVEDGQRFGRQYLSADETFYPDPGSVSKKPEGDFDTGDEGGLQKAKQVPFIDLQVLTPPVTREATEALAALSENPRQATILRNHGIARISIDYPNRFDLSTQGTFDPANGQVRLNAEADDPVGTIFHEVGHGRWLDLTEKQKTAFKSAWDEFRKAKPEEASDLVGKGYVKDYDEAHSQLFSEWAKDENSIPEQFAELFEEPVKITPREQPPLKPYEAPKNKVIRDIKNAEAMDTWLTDKDDVAGSVAKYGDFMVVIKDSYGHRHLMPASAYALLEQNKTFDQGIREVWVSKKAAQGPIQMSSGGSPSIYAGLSKVLGREVKPSETIDPGEVVKALGNKPATPPKLGQGQNQGDLLDNSERQDLTLTGEKGSDAERLAADKAKADADAAQAKRIADEQQGNLFGGEGAGPGGTTPGDVGGQPQLAQLSTSLQTLAQQNKVKPQVRAAFSLGQKMAAAKNAASRAMIGLRTAGSYMLNVLRGKPVVTKLDDILGQRHLELSESVANAREFLDKARNAVPLMARRVAISNYLDMGGDVAKLQQAERETLPQYKQGYRDAQNLTPEEKIVAENIKNYFESRLNEGRSAGVLDAAVSDYIHRMYEKDTDWRKGIMAELTSGISTRKPGLAMKRVFEYDYEAEQAGYKPVKDFARRVAEYDVSLNKAIADRKAVKAMLDVKMPDGRPMVDVAGVGKEVTADDDEGSKSLIINPKAKVAGKAKGGPDAAINNRGDYKHKDYQALKKWRWVDTDANGKDTIVQGDVLIHPDAVGKLGALFERSKIRQNPVGRAALATSSTFKQTALDLSGFHPVQITVHGWEHRTFKPVGKIDFEDPNVRGLIKGGMTVGDTDGWGLFSEGLTGSSLTRHIPGLGPKLQDFNEALFNDYIPRLKTAMALHALERNRGSYPNLTEEQLHKLTANQANAAFGGLNWEMMGVSRTTRDVLRLATFAPDFLIARAKFVGQAGTLYGREQLKALALGAATLYITARILNKLLDDKYHFEPKNAFNLIHNGKAYSLRTVQGDLMHLAFSPANFIYHRLNPVFGRTLLEGITGRDEFGRKRNTPQQLADGAKQIVPLSLKGLVNSREQSLWEGALNAFGITERRNTDIDNIYAMAENYKKANNIAEPAERIYDPDNDPYRGIKLAGLYGTPEKAADEIKKAIQSRKINQQQLFRHFEGYVTRPFTGSKAHEAKFYAQMTDDQKAIYRSAIDERKKLLVNLQKGWELYQQRK
jgi:hypothetical protein